jgi:hypothetical protein
MVRRRAMRRGRRRGQQMYANPGPQQAAGISPEQVAYARAMAAEQEIEQGRQQAQGYMDSPLGRFSGAEYVPMATRAANTRAGAGGDLGRSLMDLTRITKLAESDMLDDGQREVLRGEARRIMAGLGGGGAESGPGYLQGLDGFLSEWEGLLGGR